MIPSAFCASSWSVSARQFSRVSIVNSLSSAKYRTKWIRTSAFVSRGPILYVPHVQQFHSVSESQKLRHFCSSQVAKSKDLQNADVSKNGRHERQDASSKLAIPAKVNELLQSFDGKQNLETESSDWIFQLLTDVFPFKLDDFQLQSLRALVDGQSVVLSAPTGAGKTIVGEMAVYLALCRKMRVFYTTPLKALSNQKFYDFQRQFGEDRVGLLTGDITVNRDAEIVVMTTEIYRNMLYADATENTNGIPVTDDLFAVIFDEFHYLNDRDRGTVWEESIINSPEHVLLVALSATMSNTSDVKDWFESVQGPTALVETSLRPVPLKFAYCDHDGMTPLFASDDNKEGKQRQQKRGFGRRQKDRKKQSEMELKMHPKLLRRLKEAREKQSEDRRRRNRPRGNDEEDAKSMMKGRYRDISVRARGRNRDRYAEIPSFPYVVRTLRRREMLPCIVFIFSRAGCDRAAVAASAERDDLVTPEERERIQEKLNAFVAEHPSMVQSDRIDLALQGIASHHAGLLPLWKICVEELFQDGLIKVVFATETLAAGINMPARSTVISSLSKRAGEEGIVQLSTSEVLQMAGRAGRRGKDVVGHSMVLRSRNEGALEAFKVVTAKVDALRSKFTPNYGMVLNLLSARSLEDSKKLVERSFGNFLRQKQSRKDNETPDSYGGSSTEAEVVERERAALNVVLSEAQQILESADEQMLRSFVKGLERVKAEKRALSYLVRQSLEMDTELIGETLTFAPTGTRLLLKEKKSKTSTGAERRTQRRTYTAALAAAGEGDLGAELKAFYLDAADPVLEELDDDNDDISGNVVEAILLDMHSETAGILPTFAAVDAFGKLRLFNHNAVSQIFYDAEPVDVASIVSNWDETELPSRSKWKSIGTEQYCAPLPESLEKVVESVQVWRTERLESSKALKEGSMPTIEESAHPEVLAQKERVEHAKRLIREHKLNENEDLSLILAARRAIPKIEGTLGGKSDPFGTKRRRSKRNRSKKPEKSERKEVEDDVAPEDGNWDDFMSIVSVLQHYGFVDESYNITSLGSLGAKVKSENELWTSMLLLDPELDEVSPMHLGAIIGATQMENSRPDVYVACEASKEVKECVARAAAQRVRLYSVQTENNVDAPIHLDPELMGLVEMWCSGVTWVELLSNTSLQEGDVCRILRRCLDQLRQIQHLPMVSEGLKLNAKRTVALMDRFPVTDDRTYTEATIGGANCRDMVPSSHFRSAMSTASFIAVPYLNAAPFKTSSFVAHFGRHLHQTRLRRCRRVETKSIQAMDDVVLIDMDNTLVDFDLEFGKRWIAARPEDSLSLIKSRKYFELEQNFPEDLKPLAIEIMSQSGFFISFEPQPFAVESIKEMVSQGANVFFCTAPLPFQYETCVAEKFAWIRKHFGESFLSKIIITRDKTLIKGKVLIDDKPKITGACKDPEWTHIVFDQPYNQGVEGPRLSNWKEWKSIVDYF